MSEEISRILHHFEVEAKYCMYKFRKLLKNWKYDFQN